jgi:hypothetical protein
MSSAWVLIESATLPKHLPKDVIDVYTSGKTLKA